MPPPTAVLLCFCRICICEVVRILFPSSIHGQLIDGGARRTPWGNNKSQAREADLPTPDTQWVTEPGVRLEDRCVSGGAKLSGHLLCDLAGAWRLSRDLWAENKRAAHHVVRCLVTQLRRTRGSRWTSKTSYNCRNTCRTLTLSCLRTSLSG